jgi:1-acyl-sn-glycerol-3-phosphate acyltransferase
VSALPSRSLLPLSTRIFKRFGREALITRIHGMPRWASFCVRTSLGARVDVRGLENLVRPSKGCLYIANNQSFADILVLIPVLESVAFLSKDAVRKIPVVGACASAGGSIFVDRSSTADRKRALTEVIRMCKESTGVLVFSEGKISRDGELLEEVHFATLYRAYEEGLRVIPIGLHGTRDVVPHSLNEIKTGKPVAIRVGHAISPGDASDRETFARACWTQVQELHGRARRAVETPDAVSCPTYKTPSTVDARDLSTLGA